jgi:hypothetical protein
MLIANFVNWISRNVDRPIFDKTGLEGYYGIDLHWGDDLAGSELPSLFTVLERTLGLKLEPRKEPMAFIVVDRVDKVPNRKLNLNLNHFQEHSTNRRRLITPRDEPFEQRPTLVSRDRPMRRRERKCIRVDPDRSRKFH